MVRGVHNWSFREAVNFLCENGFTLDNVKGSHYYYVKPPEHPEYIACVPYHGSRAISPATMKSIMLQSGIARKKWLQ